MMKKWSPTGIARGTLLHAPTGRHPGQTLAHSSTGKARAFCYRGKKYHYTDDEVLEYLETLRVVAKQVFEKLPKISVIEKDPKDNPILACALKVRVDHIVSKDDHLKDLKEYRGIRIVSSQEFLELLK